MNGGDYPWAQVPSWVGEIIRGRLPAVVDDIIDSVRDEVEEYALPLEGEFGRNIHQGVTAALGQFVDLLGTDGPLPDTSVYTELGRVEHRQGRTMDALQAAYRVGARVAWRHVTEGGEELDPHPRVVYRLAEAIFAYIEQLAAASVAGYAQEQSARAGSEQARRHVLVELLARRPPADPREVERAASEAGWPLPASLAALAVGEADPVVLARRMPPGSIGAGLDPVAVVLVPDPDGPGRHAQLAAVLRSRPAVLGPTVPWQHAARSVARAVTAWPIHAAGRLGEAPLARADDHLLALLLAADPELSADLAAARLTPLAGMTEGARTRAEATLRAWLDCHGDVSAAAGALHVHPQTVRYRLGGLREAFGEVLDDPEGRLELALALRVSGTLTPPG